MEQYVDLGKTLKEGIKINFGIEYNGERTFSIYRKFSNSKIGSMVKGSALSYAELAKTKRRAMYQANAEDILIRTKYNNGEILDVGCGPGILALELAKRIENIVTGIDPSKDMIAFAKKCASEENIENVEFRLGSAEKMTEMFDNKFEIVIGRHILGRIEDCELLLRNMYDISAKTVFIRDIDRNGDWETVKETFKGRPKTQILDLLSSMPALYEPDEIKQILSKMGINKYQIFGPEFAKEVVNRYGENIDPIVQNEYVVLIKK